MTAARAAASLLGFHASQGPWGRFVAEHVQLRLPTLEIEVFVAADGSESIMVTVAVEDAYGEHPGKNAQITHAPLPPWPAGALQSPATGWARGVLRSVLLEVLTHELDEMLFVDGENAAPHTRDAETGTTTRYLKF